MTGPDEADRLALGVLMASFTGPDLPPDVADLAAAGLGSVCLFGSNVGRADGDGDESARRLAGALHTARPGIVVAIDEEGGDVTRLDAAHGSAIPGAAALGAAGDVSLTGRISAGLGRRLRAAGIDLVLAPVADLNTDPRNPIIGSRSFGAQPHPAADHAVAAVRALQGAGVAACVKHFPGHGAVAEDSHLALPRLDADGRTLRAREFVPFQAAVVAGVAAVMTGHLVVPALDPRSPASTSAAAVTVLRRELGFAGVVVTDALDMAGVSGVQAHGSVGAAAVAALLAGADLLCLGADSWDRGLVDGARAAITAAVGSGVLPCDRLAQAAGRVAALGERWSPAAVPPDTAEQPDTGATIGGAGVESAVERAADLALRLEGPVPALAGAVVLRLIDTPTIAAGPVPWDLAAPLGALIPGITGLDVGTAVDTGAATGSAGSSGVPAALRHAHGRPVVLLTRDLDRAPAVRATAAAVLAARPDAVVVDAGWPSTGLPPGVTVLRTHGSARPLLAAAARRLAAGARQDTGR